MSNTVKDGGTAFPCKGRGEGMSLRDWFAGMAMSGLCSACDENGIWTGEECVSTAYCIADAMLKAREVPQ